MSVVHELLNELEEKEVRSSVPFQARYNQEGGFFDFDLPDEILNDFYDLKEYVRIANMRGQMRALSVTSSLPGEGSSTIATYLAYLFTGLAAKKQTSADESQTEADHTEEPEEQNSIFSTTFNNMIKEKKPEKQEFTLADDILLVDANLHQPSIHEFFSLRAEGGLAEILEHQLDWKKCLKPIRNSNLKVITAGVSEILPAELLGSDVFRALVKEWREAFSYVIFDSAPVLKYVDALTLATAVDGVILVVCAGKTRWELAQDAKRKLAVAQANLLGVALNRSKIGAVSPVYSPAIAEKN